jgi:hypothetical protein
MIGDGMGRRGGNRVENFYERMLIVRSRMQERNSFGSCDYIGPASLNHGDLSPILIKIFCNVVTTVASSNHNNILALYVI